VSSRGPRCARCRRTLARDNLDRYCSSCSRQLEALHGRPPAVPMSFWEDPDIQRAAMDRHMGHLICAYRHHPGHGIPISQEILGSWANITQAQISRFETGRPEQQIDRLAFWAGLLGVPQRILWFAIPTAPQKYALEQHARFGERRPVHHRAS
jgi:hypothetical protein